MTENQRPFQSLFDNMAQGAFLQNADGTMSDVNPAALELFGLKRNEFLGRTSHTPDWRVISENGQPLHPEDHPSMSALANGKPVQGIIAGVFNPQRNSYVWMEINAIPLYREGETTPYQVFVTLHDITGRRLMEEELKEINADLTEAQRVARLQGQR
jgi:PAS domain S-box-containing protein